MINEIQEYRTILNTISKMIKHVLLLLRPEQPLQQIQLIQPGAIQYISKEENHMTKSISHKDSLPFTRGKKEEANFLPEPQREWETKSITIGK